VLKKPRRLRGEARRKGGRKKREKGGRKTRFFVLYPASFYFLQGILRATSEKDVAPSRAHSDGEEGKKKKGEKKKGRREKKERSAC